MVPSLLISSTSRLIKIKRKHPRHTEISRLKAGEPSITCQMSNYIENSGLYEEKSSWNLGVPQATTSKMPIRIDPRMKKTFLVDRLVGFLFGES